MKISTSNGALAKASRGASKRIVGERPSDDHDPVGPDDETAGDLPDLASFGDRVPRRGSIVNLLV